MASANELLVVGVDFSEPSLAAARYAASLARRLRGRVLLLHVLTEWEEARSANDDSHVRCRQELAYGHMGAHQRLADLAQELGEKNSVPIAFRVCNGDPCKLIRYQSEEAFMLVMGTRGITGERRDVIGSVVQNVVHGCDIPVLTIHADGSLARVA